MTDNFEPAKNNDDNQKPQDQNAPNHNPNPPPPYPPPYNYTYQPGLQSRFNQPQRTVYPPPYGQPNSYYRPPAAPPYPPNNYYNRQHGYYTPVYPPPAAPVQPASGIATASLVFGLVGLLLVWVPILNLLLSLTSLILGIVAKSKGNGGLSIAGIVIGGLVFALSGIIFIPLIVYIFREVEPQHYYNNEWEYTLMTALKLAWQ